MAAQSVEFLVMTGRDDAPVAQQHWRLFDQRRLQQGLQVRKFLQGLAQHAQLAAFVGQADRSELREEPERGAQRRQIARPGGTQGDPG